jgi:hypothetical protein
MLAKRAQGVDYLGSPGPEFDHQVWNPYLVAGFTEDTLYARNLADGSVASRVGASVGSYVAIRPNEHGRGLEAVNGPGTLASDALYWPNTAPEGPDFTEYTVAMTYQYDPAGNSAHVKSFFHSPGSGGGLALTYDPSSGVKSLRVQHQSTTVTYWLNGFQPELAVAFESQLCALVVTYRLARVNVYFNGRHLGQIVNLTRPKSSNGSLAIPATSAKQQLRAHGRYGIVIMDRVAWSPAQARAFALDPYACLYPETQVRSQVTDVSGYISGDPALEQAVTGSGRIIPSAAACGAEINPAVSGRAAAWPAIEGDPMIERNITGRGRTRRTH